MYFAGGGIIMDSIWKSGTKLPEFSELESDMKVDVLIIGGGITGILCAHFLQERGVDYVLCEAGTVYCQDYGSTRAHL